MIESIEVLNVDPNANGSADEDAVEERVKALKSEVEGLLQLQRIAQAENEELRTKLKDQKALTEVRHKAWREEKAEQQRMTSALNDEVYAHHQTLKQTHRLQAIIAGQNKDLAAQAKMLREVGDEIHALRSARLRLRRALEELLEVPAREHESATEDAGPETLEAP